MRSEVGMQWEGSVLNQASFFTSVLHEHCLTQRLRYRPKRQTTLFDEDSPTPLQLQRCSITLFIPKGGNTKRYRPRRYI